LDSPAPSVRYSRARQSPPDHEIRRSRDLATNRPSACSVAVGGRALRASDLRKSPARASPVEALKRCRRAIQLLRCRCRECARPAAPMIVRRVCPRSGSVVDPPSTRSWLRANEIAPVAAQMEVAAKRRVHIGHSFGQSPMRYYGHGSASQIPTVPGGIRTPFLPP
jgi:hypothetical protein